MSEGIKQVESVGVAALTHHGGRVDQAALEYPDAPQPWLDLSTGINPLPWAPSAPLQLELGRLPTSSELENLEDAVAAYFGVPADHLAAVPGTEIALRLLGTLDLAGPHQHVAPGYRTHGEAFTDSVAIDLPDAATWSGTLLFANPNNPTGRLLPREQVLALAGGGWLIIDEAFADCTPAASVAPTLPERTIVLRSFGKFFGLAGVRLGFVIAPPDILQQLRRLLGDWPVSALAIAYGTAAYRDAAWIAATRTALGEAAGAMDAVLARHGFDVLGDCPLFRLIDAGDAAALFDRLARHGVLTRPFDYMPSWLRLGLPGSAEALARLDRALADG